MRARVPLAAWGVALAMLAVSIPEAQQPTFRSAVRTVAVYATVADREGRLVPNLQRGQFRIEDNGRPADIAVFENRSQPITVAVLLDTSGSMGPRILRVREATARLIDALAPGDRARIGSFGWEVALSPLLTGDHGTLRRVLSEELWPGGPTPLWRALAAGMMSLDGEVGRRVVLVLTDGDDNDLYKEGRPTPADVRRRAVSDGFMVYAIGMDRSQRTVSALVTDDGGRETHRGVVGRGNVIGGLTTEMIALVEETGGGHFELPSDTRLEETFVRVAEELRHQYLLGFVPDVMDGRVHRLAVSVTVPGCRVRARGSYVAEAGR